MAQGDKEEGPQGTTGIPWPITRSWNKVRHPQACQQSQRPLKSVTRLGWGPQEKSHGWHQLGQGTRSDKEMGGGLMPLFAGTGVRGDKAYPLGLALEGEGTWGPPLGLSPGLRGTRCLALGLVTGVSGHGDLPVAEWTQGLPLGLSLSLRGTWDLSLRPVTGVRDTGPCPRSTGATPQTRHLG